MKKLLGGLFIALGLSLSLVFVKYGSNLQYDFFHDTGSGHEIPIFKIFGSEFCELGDAGSCINVKEFIDAKTFFGDYKYPIGRKAFYKCVNDSDGTDGGLAPCSMIFHREEQSHGSRIKMCSFSVREGYEGIASDYAVKLYDFVWGCNPG